jgi:polysaccharide biosynthesis/export protein
MNMQSHHAQRHTQFAWDGLAVLDKDSSASRSLTITRAVLLGFAILLLTVGAAGQEALPLAIDRRTPTCDSEVRSTYLLGPDDQLEISEPELAEIATANKPSRVDGEGDIQVPLVGRVHVSGLTVQQLEQKLDKLLSTYIRHPKVAVNVAEVRSQPVSIIGAVNTPGVHQVQGHKTLLEMLALAGGIRSDAGYSIRITRQLQWGCIPLPTAQLDASGQFSVAEVNLKRIIDAEHPEDNIRILPHDIVSVPKAEMVYVIGEVKRSGGFVLGEDQSISVLQALSLAEGLNGTADTRHARILRVKPNADQREEVPVNVKDVLRGKKSDIALRGNDILFIPGSTGKKAALRTIEAAIQTGSGFAIWRTP